jgi:sodium transport system permease protein
VSFSNIRLIFFRELRDQLRDRRTLFTVVVLPLLLYPLMGMLVFQVQQFLRERPSKVRIVGTDALPEQPRLIVDEAIAEEFGSSKLIELELLRGTQLSFEELKSQSQHDIQLGLCDAVVYFSPDFAEQLVEHPSDGRTSLKVRPICDVANDRSKIAAQRIKSAIENWEQSIRKKRFDEIKVSAAVIDPFEVEQVDVSQPTRRRAALWSKVLPFILMIWALTGAFYPAVDLCAGEKERGTLETLLSSPAARGEIVWGKLLTVMTFSMATAILNLASMTATGTFIVSQIQRMGAVRPLVELGPPPLAALAWLMIALVPISALFSALSLAIAAFARSSKEGHYYLLPLLMISLPLMMLSVFPGAELDLGFAFIPLSGLLMLLRALMEGQYIEALRFSLPVVGVTAVCCLLAIRWAVDQFNNESVLFRESERFELGTWVRHLVRDREDLPTVGEALLCGVLLLVARFFYSLVAPMPANWNDLATTTLTLLIAFIAAPACFMAIMLTRRPAKSLLLCPPSFAVTIPAAGLLAVALHPAMLWLNEAIRILYPLSPAALFKLREIEGMFAAAPLWQVFSVVCLAPAICEELAFRGFILSGLRRMGHMWGAIVISALFFGLAHGILQQSIGATVIGIVIGYVAVKTGSLLPGMVYHAVHNGLSVMLGRLSPEVMENLPLLRLVLEPGAEPGEFIYRWPVALVALAVAGGLIWWLKGLPYQHSSEERLQEALDSQIASVPAQPAAMAARSLA